MGGLTPKTPLGYATASLSIAFIVSVIIFIIVIVIVDIFVPNHRLFIVFIVVIM